MQVNFVISGKVFSGKKNRKKKAKTTEYTCLTDSVLGPARIT